MLRSGIYKLEVAKRLNGSTTVKIIATIKIAHPDSFKMIGFDFIVKSESVPIGIKTFWAYVGSTAFVPITDKELIDVLNQALDNSNVEEETLKKTDKLEIVRVKRTLREGETTGT